MGQQISMDAAFSSYRERATDLFHENVLLKAQITEMEAELTSLRAAGQTAPVDGQEPVPSSSYLAGSDGS
jgi:hypothetical protein